MSEANKIIKRFTDMIISFRSVSIFSEDAQYKYHFLNEYMPELYRKHSLENYTNCIFCTCLVRSHCHSHCFKCGVGTYIKCSPALPGAVYKEPAQSDDEEIMTVPWYYRKTCYHFKRLPQRRYFKNIYPLLSSIGIYNLEILEGLEKGLSAGVKPCHVCASIDYELYQKCSRQGDFNSSTPCHKITEKLKAVYENQASNSRMTGKA